MKRIQGSISSAHVANCLGEVVGGEVCVALIDAPEPVDRFAESAAQLQP
jgi:hypothetical protein